MKRIDADEAAPIAQRMLTHLNGAVPAKGRAGSDARSAIGDARANALALIVDDAMGPPLNECFRLALAAGASWQQIDTVRYWIAQEAPVTLGGKLLKNSAIRLCLSTTARIIARMSFVSRQDVNAIKAQLYEPFQDAIEVAADDMDQMTFQTLVGLHGAVTNHLVNTARPLPRMVGFEFFAPLPSLVVAYRLYDDASRADELREENKVVHPAFCQPTGIALSS
jgi:hypothetical protein